MWKPFKNLPFVSVIVCTSLLLSACGGGSGDSPEPIAMVSPPTPPVAAGPTWTRDVFEPEANFINRCENPRTGTNPATGSPFPDIAGSTLFENHWLRSWSNDTYLWYNEIEDVDPGTVSDRLAYFELMKTTETTSSGSDKDNFHFSRNTAEYQEQVSTGASSGYGVRFVLINAAPPREIRVSLVEPNAEAAMAPINLQRGALIVSIDGVDVANGSDVDTLNAGLFPSSDGEMHEFVVQDIGSTTTRTITLTSQTVVSSAVAKTEVLNTATGRVGYVLFNTFGIQDAETQIIDAMNEMSTQNVQDLVLDLRYNGGGFLDIAGQLGYMIAGPTRSAGRTFDRLTFNDKYPNTDPVTGRVLRPTPFHSTSLGFSRPQGQTLPSLNLDRIFILSTSRTCSASEAVINGLRGVDVEVVLVGTRTCGKPYGFYPTDNCGETYFTIQFSGQNDKGFGEYSDGFTPMNAATSLGELVPGCEVADDYLNQLGDVNEAMLATALSYRANGVCPTTATRSGIVQSKFAQAETDTIFDMLNSTEAGSLYNSDHFRDHLYKEMSLNQRSIPNGVEFSNEN